MWIRKWLKDLTFLVKQRAGKPDLSILFNHLSELSLVSWITTASFKVWSKRFSWLFTGLSVIVGVNYPESLKWSSDNLLFFKKLEWSQFCSIEAHPGPYDEIFNSF